ncbi:hypothetical protein ACEWY4_003990 [Coilia grayii]|uniref:Ig-like domain-containing protein n=1 Tax=Coilia grayii TaxID=363190 RepID=A0ABD1KK86_9TELE
MRCVKMQFKYMEIFILMCFFHACTPEIVPDGQREKVICSLKKDPSLTIMWLRATENDGIRFLVSYKNNKMVAKTMPTFIETENDGYTLIIKSFKKQTDSGKYNCATYNANTLTFGTASHLEGKPDPIPTKKPKTPTVRTTCTTATAATATAACVCPRGMKKGDPEKACELLIWAPLAAGCGLLLLLLIAVSIICNSECLATTTTPVHQSPPQHHPHTEHLIHLNSCDVRKKM